jgi:hypothetical protein
MALLFAATCTGTPDGVETATGALTVVTFEGGVAGADDVGDRQRGHLGDRRQRRPVCGAQPQSPVNSWIQFTLPNVAAGTYDVKLLYKANYNRGIVQAASTA